MTVLGSLKKCYTYLAILTLNALLIFLAINLIFAALLTLRDSKADKGEAPRGRFAFTEYSSELKPVYPHMTPEEVEAMLKENRSIPIGYRPFVQFAEKPFNGKFVNVDPSGFRPIQDQAKWPPEKSDRNIFIFGGSTTFGAGVTDDETIASYLQKHLKDRGFNDVKIYNFGHGHYFSSQEMILFQQLLLQDHKPYLAIFVDGLNDLNHFTGDPAFTRRLTKFMDDGEISSVWNLILDLPISRYFLKKPLPTNGLRSDDPKEIADRVTKRYGSNKKLIDNIAKGYDVRTLFVWQPIAIYEYDQEFNIFSSFNYSKGLPYLKIGYETMSGKYEDAEFGTNFLWLADMQRDLKEPLYIDAVHYSARMCDLIASRIADRIVSLQLLN